MKFTLTSDLISKLKSFIYSDHEVCGNINYNSKLECKNVDSIINGTTDEKNRKMCMLEKYSKIVYHSHPEKNTRSYPSVEDIQQVSKPNKILASILACKWGIWIMTINPNFKSTKNYIEDIRPYADNIGKHTNDIDKSSHSLNKSDYSIIEKNIQHIKKICQVHIFLYEWNNLYN